LSIAPKLKFWKASLSATAEAARRLRATIEVRMVKEIDECDCGDIW
jgi:hypothetical protein